MWNDCCIFVRYVFDRTAYMKDNTYEKSFIEI